MKDDARAPGEVCTIRGCDKRIFGRGWCQKHWTRWRRHGDPLHTEKRMDMSMVERFFDQVEVTETCWIWRGTVSDNGYGTFQGSLSPHRFAYQTWVGPIPDGFHVDHTCHNSNLSCRGLGPACLHRRCCNPDHLEAVSPSTNIRRAIGERTHCRHGHELTPENTRTRFHRTQGRVIQDCRTCAREQNTRRRRGAAG